MFIYIFMSSWIQGSTEFITPEGLVLLYLYFRWPHIVITIIFALMAIFVLRKPKLALPAENTTGIANS